MITRRSLLKQAVTTGALSAAAGASTGAFALSAQSTKASPASSFVPLLRVPDTVAVFTSLDEHFALTRNGDEFTGRDVVVSATANPTELHLSLVSPTSAPVRVHVRWMMTTRPDMKVLIDAWERSYGDLGWYGITPERAMPWYFATFDGSRLHAYGVKTGAAAMCFWQLDGEGVSLWLDVSNGGDGVQLGHRKLMAATVVSREGAAGEEPVAALRAFCQQMCPAPRLPSGPIFGVNDWYTAYGNNSESMLLPMAELAAELAPRGGPKPYAVVDEGWSEGTPAWPSMAAFAEKVKGKGVRPGIWIRSLEAKADTSESLVLPAERFGPLKERAKERAFDPTVPEAMEAVLQRVRLLRQWGFDMVKHDYSTYDLLGRFGFEMGAQPTLPGWHFHDRSRTNAEIIREFYTALRGALGDRITIIGCTTVGHLAAGIFELQRTGDDTSGKVWERTRRMGVNTLAFRLPQHGTFYGVDPDCVGVTRAISWSLNRQWLDVVARTKTTLFVSPEQGQVHAEQRKGLREAFAHLCSDAGPAVPADFFHSTTPEDWKSPAGTTHYQWSPDGALPFTV